MPSPLAASFFSQSQFAAGYAPLYERLFGLVGGWLEDEGDGLGRWLVEVSRERAPLEVTLLLMAGLHDAVLGGHAAAAELSPYYQSVGGRRPPDRELAEILRRAVAELRPRLANVIQEWQVQTNETGRGLAWLLPLTMQRWPEVDLVDLGASAGLNLAADRRSYQLINGENKTEIGRLGQGQVEQFVSTVSGYTNQWGSLDGEYSPQIIQRLGCDSNPFVLDSAAKERQLMSYVWADHTQRLARLQEGIAAVRDVDITLSPVRLPDELPKFLASLPPSDRPLILYNTVITMYFPDHVTDLKDAIAQWAGRQNRPVLWVQWEPADEKRSETTMAWTTDLWHHGRHTHELIGLVHPHGHFIAV